MNHHLPLREQLRASQSAKPDQIELHGTIEAAAAALDTLAYSIRCREIMRPGAPPSPFQTAKARVIIRNLSRALDAFKEHT